jgi:hypothetical protein
MRNAKRNLRRKTNKPASGVFDVMPLESRLLMSGTHALNEVPALNSLPGAAHTIYLDFNGDVALHNTPAYDLDGNVTSFNDAELASITKVWAMVADKFSPFNVNVTTVAGTSGAYKALIGGKSWAGAVGGIATGGIAYVFSGIGGVDSPAGIGGRTVHELGHIIGLRHQSLYNASGVEIAEYHYGSQQGWWAPIMGTASAPRVIWYRGTSTSATTIQDDLAVLGARLGYRADAPDAALVPESDGRLSASGIIGKTTDEDVFTFTTTGGSASFTVDRVTFGMLNPAIKLIDSNGAVIAFADNAVTETNKLGDTISVTLAAGTYRVIVYSHGSYGDVGQYILTGTGSGATMPTPAPAPAPTPTPTPTPEPEPIPAPVMPPEAPSQLTATTLSSSQIRLAWQETSTNATGFVIERSIDGVNFTKLATVGAADLSFDSMGLTASTTYRYRIYATSAEGNSAYSATTSATTLSAAPVAPSQVSASAVSCSQLRLSWQQTSTNVTGFYVERSADGVNFTRIASVGASARSYDNTGLNPSTTYRYRVIAASTSGNSACSSVAIATTQAAPAPLPSPAMITAGMTAPSNLSVRHVGGHYVTLTWNDNSTSETGFEIWKSGDGVKWSLVKVVPTNTTTWTNANDNAYGKTYFWKVRAVNKYTSIRSDFTSVATVFIPTDGKVLSLATLNNL